MPKTRPFDENYNTYEKWFEINKYVFKSELKALKHFIPQNKKGLEIGIGSGIFAKPLGIKVGNEPSKEMRRLARERNLTVYDDVAENLSFKDNSFDFALMVTTICFVDDIKKSFQEVKRVLNKKGIFIIGLVDKKTSLGEKYKEHKEESVFYKEAVFYSTKEVLSLLKDCGFKNPEVVQTVFGDLSKINNIQNFKKGFGEGGFVAIKTYNN